MPLRQVVWPLLTKNSPSIELINTMQWILVFSPYAPATIFFVECETAHNTGAKITSLIMREGETFSISVNALSALAAVITLR